MDVQAVSEIVASFKTCLGKPCFSRTKFGGRTALGHQPYATGGHTGLCNKGVNFCEV